MGTLTLASRNCTLTRRNCKYLIARAGEGSQPGSAISWPTIVESSCQRWKDSGEPPFPFLQLPTSPSWHHLSMSDLRYMHHLALLASILELSKTKQFCLWWNEFSMCVPVFHVR